jgi:hypothetical protein
MMQATKHGLAQGMGQAPGEMELIQLPGRGYVAS